MDISEDRLITFVEEHYQLHITELSALAGYIDKNYKISCSNNESYILKLSISDPLFFIEAQNTVLEYVSANSSLFPKVIQTSKLESILEFEEYKLRILTFMKGEFLDDQESISNTLVNDFATQLALMDNALLDLHLPTLSHIQLDWDIQNTLQHKGFLPLINEIEIRRIIHYFLLQFDEIVTPLLPSLRKSVIHNDANPMNVLVADDTVTGIIDFGDMVYTATIFESAIAITYLMMDSDDPLRIAQNFIRSYHAIFPLKEEEISILYYLIASRLCTSLLMAANSRGNNPQNTYASKDEIRAKKLIKKVLAINPVAAEQSFREACGMPKRNSPQLNSLLTERNKHISTAQSISYDEAIIMNKAALQYMYDEKGSSFIDCVNNIMHVGHCHPKIVEAGQRQLAQLNTNTRYIYQSLNKYAQRLSDKLPKELNKIFFVNSGSAASDLAIRLAKTYTKRDQFIIIDQGYHGNTQIGIDISSYKFDSKGGEGAKSHIHKIAMPDTYRDPRTGEKYADEVDSILSRNQIAGFVGESILSCGGQLVLPNQYFQNIYKKIRASGGVCIADEVQVGFGRVGSHFWGFELQDVIPDIVIMGKPIGNGHPLAAVATTDKIANAFDNGMEFFSSFGGNPVSCEIGLAVLDVIDEEALQEHALNMGQYILSQWEELMSRHDCIGDVRGVGLFLGMEFVTSRETKEPDEVIAHQIVQVMKDRYFLLSTDGPYHNVIKFKPPMVFGKDEADLLYKNLHEVISGLH